MYVPSVNKKNIFDKFETDLDIIVDRFYKDTNPPDILYHYTKCSNAHSIIKTNEFWTNDCRNMVDKNEIKSADKIIINVASNLMKLGNATTKNTFLNLVTEYFKRGGTSEVLKPFISCFSSDKYLTKFWKDDTKYQICLGIQRLKDEEAPTYEGLALVFLPVDYSMESVEKRIYGGFNDVHRTLLSYSSKHKDYISLKTFRGIARYALLKISSYVALSTKDPIWAEEKEWRIVVVERQNYAKLHKITTSHNKLNTYKIKLRKDNKPIKFNEIIIGPNRDLHSEKYKLLKSFDIDNAPDINQYNL